MSALVEAPARTYERLAALPLHVGRLRPRGARARRQRRVHPPDHGRAAERRRARGPGRGRDVHAARPARLPRRRARPAARRAVDARVVLRAPRRARPLPRRHGLPGLPRLPPLGLRERGPGPGAQAGGLLTGRRAGPHAPPGRFVVSPGPEASAAPVHERLARYPGMRLKLMPDAAWDDSSPSWPPPALSTSSTSRASTRSPCPSPCVLTPTSTAGSWTPSRTPGSRTRASQRRPPRCSPPTGGA